jgi:hypothetical protein
VGKRFGVKPQNICLRIRVTCFTKRGLKSKEARERQSAEARETDVFGLVFLFEQRDDALDDAKLFYLFVVVVPK